MLKRVLAFQLYKLVNTYQTTIIPRDKHNVSQSLLAIMPLK